MRRSNADQHANSSPEIGGASESPGPWEPLVLRCLFTPITNGIRSFPPPRREPAEGEEEPTATDRETQSLTGKLVPRSPRSPPRSSACGNVPRFHDQTLVCLHDQEHDYRYQIVGKLVFFFDFRLTSFARSVESTPMEQTTRFFEFSDYADVIPRSLCRLLNSCIES